MAEIRIQEDVTPSTPPSGSSTLFIDVADNKAKQLRSDGSIIDLTAGAASGAQTTQIINSAADLPIPSGGVINLAANTNYVLGDNLSINDRFDVSAGNVSWTSNNLFGPKLTYTGGLTLFTGVDTSFNIKEAALDCPNGQVFDFKDVSSPGSSIVQMDSVVVDSCSSWGSFEDLLSLLIVNSSCLDADGGVVVSGNTFLIQSAIKFALVSSNPAFVGYDLGSSVSLNIEMANFVFGGPIGSIGVSGLPNSGNIASGGGATMRDCNFISPLVATGGGLDPSNDVRWRSRDNTGVQDTMPGALSFSRTPSPTNITAIGVPAPIDMVFTEQRASFFTTNSDGEIEYVGEVPIDVEIDIITQVAPVSGTNRDITVYVAIDSGGGYVVDTDSGFQVTADSGNPQTSIVAWELILSPGDKVRGYVSNDTVNADVNVNTNTFRVR